MARRKPDRPRYRHQPLLLRSVRTGPRERGLADQGPGLPMPGDGPRRLREVRRAGARLRVREILFTGAFFSADLSALISGQFLSSEFPPPCGADGPRQVFCPLEERAIDGDAAVPCSWAQESWCGGASARDPAFDLRPCDALCQLAQQHLHLLLGLPEGWQPPVADEVLCRRLREEGRALGALFGQGTTDERRVARFLLDTGRLTLAEVRLMIELSIPVTDPRFLPCRDDRQRDRFLPQRGEGHDAAFRASRVRCPLQVRALLSDVTVPCAMALSAPPEDHLVQLSWKAHPDGPEEHRVVRHWTEAAQAPGGPVDVVRVMDVLPCELLGRVLQRELPILLERLAGDVAWYEEDLQLLGLRKDLVSAPDAQIPFYR